MGREADKEINDLRCTAAEVQAKYAQLSAELTSPVSHHETRCLASRGSIASRGSNCQTNDFWGSRIRTASPYTTKGSRTSWATNAGSSRATSTISALAHACNTYTGHSSSDKSTRVFIAPPSKGTWATGQAECFSVPPKQIPAHHNTHHNTFRSVTPCATSRYPRWGRFTDTGRRQTEHCRSFSGAAGVVC